MRVEYKMQINAFKRFCACETSFVKPRFVERVFNVIRKLSFYALHQNGNIWASYMVRENEMLEVLSVREASLIEGTTLGKLREGMAIQTLRTAKTIQQAIERIMWMVPSLLR